MDLGIRLTDGRWLELADLRGTPVLLYVFATFDAPSLGGVPATVQTQPLADGWQRVLMTWQLPDSVAHDDLAVTFTPTFEPDTQWIPHLAPLPGVVVGQHLFRSPAIFS